MTGKLIVIDGTDGSGKGTQTKILVEKIKSHNIDVEMVDFPRYGQKSATLVEEYLNGKYGSASEVGPYKASIFYAVDRFAASYEIKKALASGKVVISNRYVSANMGHQAGKIKNQAERDKFLEWLHELEYKLFEIPEPDLNILLYMHPEISQKLVDQKGHRDYVGGEKRDIHEADLQHLLDATEAYKYVAKKFNWHIIDCAPNKNLRTIDDISLELWRKIASELNIGTPASSEPRSNLNFNKNSRGKLEVISGCMFAGKTEELLRRLKRASIAKKKTMLFKSSLDNRYSDTEVISHDNNSKQALIINQAKEILYHINKEIDVVGIDEAQFFDKELAVVCEKLSNQGILVIVAGLDTTFEGTPFGPMPELMALAEKVTKLTAICSSCGADASRNLRLTETKETIGIGGAKEYQPLCRNCYVKNSTSN